MIISSSSSIISISIILIIFVIIVTIICDMILHYIMTFYVVLYNIDRIVEIVLGVGDEGPPGTPAMGPARLRRAPGDLLVITS